ncbi:hypothetical protein JW859_11035 [bacterium]|nr:hypothetical protein [bacterium]
MPRIILTICVLMIGLAAPAWACEWPADWLGPADTSYRVLNIGVYYHAAVLHDLADAEGNPALPGSSAEWLAALATRPELAEDAMRLELARVRYEVEEAARFYWHNSRFNCALDYEWNIDFQPRLRSSIADSEAPWFRPVDHPYYGDARERYDGLFQIMVLYQYDDETGELERVRGGGGWTWGCDGAEHLGGWSWWAACTPDNYCGSDWLVTHEFGHQLDSLFEASGHPEFWYNHLAPLEGNCETFGEHFDANSYILRRVPEADWLDLTWGELRSSADADQDGVPDPDDWLNARGLAVDPDPTAPDSDGDGLDDYHELLASNGIAIGHGERLYPALKLCDPRDRDTDRDGIPDGLDARPMLPMAEGIPQVGPATEPAAILFTGSPDGLDLGVELSYQREGWVSDELPDQPGYLLLQLFWGTPEQADDELELKLMLDLDNNGWFAGTDNYRLTVDSAGQLSVARHDAGSATEWPYLDSEAVDVTQIETGGENVGNGYLHSLSIKLDRRQFPELGAKPGEVIGFNAGIRKAGWRWYYMLGEPNTLIPLELR